MSEPTIRVLSTGYWHVRWGRERFAQWPVGSVCRDEDVFHGLPGDAEVAQRLAASPSLTPSETQEDV